VRDKKVKRIVYASSSSVYGDNKDLIKVEDKIGKPLSPYAISKYSNELYANVFARTYKLETVGLRYFNVYGHRQYPHGSFAAVIPLFIKAVRNDEPAIIYGDGKISRDFTFVENVVQANIRALLTDNKNAMNEVYYVGCGESTTVHELWKMINVLEKKNLPVIYKENRMGDIQHSLASINKITTLLNYKKGIDVRDGLLATLEWSRKLFA
jgi:UDP-N-acetylglucosamine 4-epimerase